MVSPQNLEGDPTLPLTATTLNFVIATVILLVLVGILAAIGMRGKDEAKRGPYKFILYMCVIGLVFTAIVVGVFTAGLL
jgi:hypothetical protein